MRAPVDSGEIVALVPAAGSGNRLGGSDGPKALRELNGRSLLQRTVDSLQPHVPRILAGVPAAQVEPQRLALHGLA